jgi:23S rRNA (uracil1939-C5)-methyltransferase
MARLRQYFIYLEAEMAQFFKAKPNSSKQLSGKLSLEITQLDHLGAGMAQHQGKVVFVPGALPGEKVTVQLTEQKKNYARARLIEITAVSTERTVPQCPHYGSCGGCDLQHLSLAAQRDHKQAALGELMSRACGVKVEMAPAITGEGWHYRRRARLATCADNKDKSFTLGFRAAASNQVVSIRECPVLGKPLSDLIVPLAKVLSTVPRSILGHVELIDADNGHFVVLRITKPLKDKDRQRLAEFAGEHKVQLQLQDNEGLCESLNDTQGKEAPLPGYQLGQPPLNLRFSPGNFVQVNAGVNGAMVAEAIAWLDIKPGERVLDLFCGMGNFSLPLAQAGAEVIGVEGVADMVQRARHNASDNQLEGMSFYHADLGADLSSEPWLGKIDKLLLDPARAGAFESLQWLKKMKPKRVVYVSCNPASLARDSRALLAQGYRLQKLSMLDMFPQTHHIEAMALFELVK